MPDSDALIAARGRLKAAWDGDGTDSELTHAIAGLVAAKYPADDLVLDVARKLSTFLAEREFAEDRNAHGGARRVPQVTDNPLLWAPAIQGKAFFDGEIAADQLHQLPTELPLPPNSSGLGEVSEGMAYLAVALHPDDRELELNLDRLNDYLVAKERLEQAHAHGGRPPQLTVLDTYARVARHPGDEALQRAAYASLRSLAAERDAVAQLGKYKAMAPRVVTGQPLVQRATTEPSVEPSSGGGTGRGVRRNPSFPPKGPETSAHHRTRRPGTLR